MRIFARGMLVALVAGLLIGTFIPDTPTEISDLIISLAFVSGAVSQVIKQLKESE